MRKVILLLIVFFPMVLLAYYTRMANGIMWTYDVKDGKAMIVEGDDGSSIPRGTLGDIVIPETLAGCPVTSIESYAFHGCQALTSVTIPESVTHIKSWAFMYCTGLTSVMIPSSVIEIGDYAFRDCCSLEAVTIPKRVTYIGNGAFVGCSCLESVTFLAREAKVCYSAFDGCNRLKAVNIEDLTAWCGTDFLTSTANPLSYAHKLFVNGSEVIDLQIPDGVESIGYSAFSGCSGLKSVTIPSSVTSIGASAFSGCNGLTIVYVASKDAERVAALYPFDKSVKFVDPFLPTGLTASDGAFVDRVCISWTDAKDAIAHDIYRSTTEIRPDSAMETGVTSPYSDTSAEPGVEYYYWVAAVNSSGSIVSSAETGYRAVSLSLDKISDSCGATAGSGGISVTANTSWCASSNVDWLTVETASGGGDGMLTYTIEANATTSERVGSITVTAGFGTAHPETKTVTVFQTTDFSVVDGVLTRYTGEGGSVRIPGGITAIGDFAFQNCEELTSLIIPEGVVRIGSRAFEGCRALMSIEIPESVTNIGEGAFCWCDRLLSVTIPPRVTSVEGYLFYECGRLATIRMSENVADIGSRAFYGCNNLTTVAIPSTVTNIGAFAFYKCGGLTSVTIPEGVLVVESGVFCDCSGLNSVEIVPGMATIGNQAFLRCVGLISVSLPSGVSIIGDSAFYGCSELSSVTIPSTVTRIEGGAFLNCGKLNVVYVYAGDAERVEGLFAWPSGVKFVEIVMPTIEGDEGAMVTGDAETGFVIKPSEGKTAVEVTIPQGVDAAKVTVEVSVKVTSVKPNGAKVKVVSGGGGLTLRSS